MDHLLQGADRSAWWRASKARPVLDVEERFLDSSSDGRDSLDEVLEKAALVAPERRRFGCMFWATLLNVLVLGATVMVASGYPLRVIDPNACVKATSSYSPVLQSVPIEFQTVHFNGTLYPGEDPAWSRRAPGDVEAEAKWESFELVDTFPITRADILALGKDPETAARYSSDFGLGDDTYIASLDVQHKVHCLNELRAMAFADFGDTSPAKHQHGQLWWIHLRHCVDMLAQDLLCHADADVITYRWIDTQPNPFPDFSLNRQCRNVDAVLAYRDANRVDMDQYMKMPKPKAGITQVPMDREYYAMYGFKDSDLYPDGEGFGPMPPTDWFGVAPKDGVPPGDRAHSHS